jgi:AhpD family alkylhydroperoxidase
VIAGANRFHHIGGGSKLAAWNGTGKESTMKPRLNWFGKSNDGIKAMQQVEAFLAGALDKKLLALVKLRASQINGCAYCLHMHSEEARAAGEREERMLLLDAWHESALYTEKERAALAWTEALTKISETHAPDATFAEVRKHFSDDELVALSIAIGMINAWNRLSIGFRAQHPADLRHAA